MEHFLSCWCLWNVKLCFLSLIWNCYCQQLLNTQPNLNTFPVWVEQQTIMKAKMTFWRCFAGSSWDKLTSFHLEFDSTLLISGTSSIRLTHLVARYQVSATAALIMLAGPAQYSCKTFPQNVRGGDTPSLDVILRAFPYQISYCTKVLAITADDPPFVI